MTALLWRAVSASTRERGSCAPARAWSAAVPNRRGQPIRPRLDDFDLCLEPTGASFHSDASITEAKRITFIYGGGSSSIQEYELLFGYAPAHDLQALRKRGGIIVMAPTIPAWLYSKAAEKRRGGPLSEKERSQIWREYGPDSGAVAAYDARTDSLVLPTVDVSPDPLHPVLHELGHAMTFERAWQDFRALKWVLDCLPRRIQDHLANGYPEDDSDESIRIRVAEVLAEAYAMVLAGRLSELPDDLASALSSIVADMGQQASTSRGKVDPRAGRTATYIPPETMVQAGPEQQRSADLPTRSSSGHRRLLERQARPWPPVEK